MDIQFLVRRWRLCLKGGDKVYGGKGHCICMLHSTFCIAMPFISSSTAIFLFPKLSVASDRRRRRRKEKISLIIELVFDFPDSRKLMHLLYLTEYLTVNAIQLKFTMKEPNILCSQYSRASINGERDFLVKLCAMEIYNEAVRDLLSPDSYPLRVLDDPERGTVVGKLTEVTLRNREHLHELLAICEAQRQIGETSMNETSSRSHQILRLTIERCTREYAGARNSSILAASVIKLFLTEEPPSQVGLGAQDHLQEKASSVSHLNGAAADDFLPPGFEGAQSTNHIQVNVLEIPAIRWRCPHRVNVENCHYDDHLSPQIPITPIEDEDEDEDAAIESLSDVLAPFGAPISSQPSVSSASAEESPSTGMVLSVEPGVAAATTAALRAINQSNECGNIFYPDLLVKILSNPQLIEKLVTDYGAASGAQNLPKSTSFLVPSSYPHPPANISDPSPSANTIENGIASVETTSGVAHYAEYNGVGVGPSNRQGSIPSVHPVSPSPAPKFPQKKDVNYYKNLIQQHGEERQGSFQNLNNRYNLQPRPNQQPTNNPKSRDPKPRVMKPCSYFNSSRGCRNGANCAFQHITSSQNRVSNNSDVPSAKRIKLDKREKQFENTSKPFFT
ncbi:Mitochondrial [Hibiscus syriacus]|uniref:Mitochondrial n=1 Tax=Hibiscus syriacus TaxID=106335 RepID=A0A6A3C3S3_HIBSY|nr:Mitochondrial [Hibiscus syriacus]